MQGLTWSPNTTKPVLTGFLACLFTFSNYRGTLVSVRLHYLIKVYIDKTTQHLWVILNLHIPSKLVLSLFKTASTGSCNDMVVVSIVSIGRVLGAMATPLTTCLTPQYTRHSGISRKSESRSRSIIAPTAALIISPTWPLVGWFGFFLCVMELSATLCKTEAHLYGYMAAWVYTRWTYRSTGYRAWKKFRRLIPHIPCVVGVV